MCVLGGISNNSSNTVMKTLEPAKIRNREAYKQGITVVKTTSNQSVCSQKSSITCEIPTESLKIPDMNKISLTDITDVAREGKIQLKPNIKVPNHLSR